MRCLGLVGCLFAIFAILRLMNASLVWISARVDVGTVLWFFCVIGFVFSCFSLFFINENSALRLFFVLGMYLLG